ncbi:hypothetical protein GCK72_007150 [Caenorhabditis remanei]|uniref:Uncharacterized protein n=1 Tax=Caenorhabditis remanei TaxID=31234 RepID=A0A6A5HJ69_CAERE|nr:hypothetical protein GCK72_007150 [Caenorhabditis remanei]KAF1767191.1 hypothetical protein GCK72_007150 [Caenorhabditis remanei]
MLPIVLHLHWLYDDEKHFYSLNAVTLYFISICLVLTDSEILNNEHLPTAAKWFVRHRYLLAAAMIAFNILILINSVIHLVGLWENIVVACMLAIVIIYLPISTWFHFDCCTDFLFSHLKSTKLSKKQWLLLFGFHTVLAALYAILFLFDESCLGNKEFVLNFQFIRYFCQLINIMSIPMSYQAILLWNSDKLKFKEWYPTTMEWAGLMKRNPDGTWEIDQSPEDHNVLIV